MDERSARLAANEAIFRSGNELIDAMVGETGEAPYLCECGRETCFDRISLNHQEYEAVRAHPARFVVVPGHQDLTGGEVVVDELDRYMIVEKRGAEAEIVARSDPRAGDTR